LIGFVMRYARPTGPDFRILELGCGSGGNIPFFKSLGCQYYTVEGSRLVLEQVVWKNHPDLKDKAFQGDFTAELPVPGDFDLIVDRSSLICNNEAAIRRGLALARGKLKPGGKYIAIDWFSTRHPEFQRGRAAEDARTRTGFEDGVFANLGRIHFCDRAHLLDLFGGFGMVVLEHKLIERELPDDGWKIATWNLVARKPA
jgi:SAM-dependent methyltransferase